MYWHREMFTINNVKWKKWNVLYNSILIKMCICDYIHAQKMWTFKHPNVNCGYLWMVWLQESFILFSLLLCIYYIEHVCMHNKINVVPFFPLDGNYPSEFIQLSWSMNWFSWRCLVARHSHSEKKRQICNELCLIHIPGHTLKIQVYLQRWVKMTEK